MGLCTPKILYVDDEPRCERIFRHILAHEGYEIDYANSAADAIQKAQQYSYPLIVSDLRMPKMDGLSLIHKMMPNHPSSIFMLATGVADLELPRSSHLDRQLLAVLLKPWESDVLRSSVHRAFELYSNRIFTENREELTILLIEDDQADARTVKRVLERAQCFQLTHVKRLKEAIEELQNNSFHLILSDLSLPDACGLDAIVRLRRAAPESALVVLTGIDDQDLAVQSAQLGAHDFLVKHRDDDTLLCRSIRYAVERSRAEQRYIQLSHTDRLTGLANKVNFRQRVAHALERCERIGQAAVLFIDLDNFKPVNDTLGHEAGDRLLSEVALRLQECVRTPDTVARMGGDEFAVLLEDYGENYQAEEICDRIISQLSRPFEFEGQEIYIGGSIGIAAFPSNGSSVDELINAADLGMYFAKNSGGMAWRRAPVATLSSGKSIALTALCNEEFEVHYQPQVEMNSGRVVAMEAMMRWRCKSDELLLPGEFIEALEKDGSIIQIGDWVLRTACQALNRSRAACRDMRVTVNMSAIQVMHGDLVQSVQNALSSAHIRGENLELELTESVLLKNSVKTRKTLQSLKALGVRIALDDFGTGYSALGHLPDYPVDVLKIDRSFVEQIVAPDDKQPMVDTIIDVGHKLGLAVTAVGIETAIQNDYLSASRCDFGQGYFYGRPTKIL